MSRSAAAAISAVEPAKEKRRKRCPRPGSKSIPGVAANSRLRQHAAAELLAVIGQPRNIRIDVEGAVRGGEIVEARAWQFFQEHPAVFRIALYIAVEFRFAVEHRLGGELRQGRRRDEEVLRQPLHRPQQDFRQDHPAEAPASHGEVLGKAIDHDGFVAKGQSRRRRFAVGNPVIDLIGDQSNSIIPAIAVHGAEFLARQHGAGWV